MYVIFPFKKRNVFTGNENVLLSTRQVSKEGAKK